MRKLLIAMGAISVIAVLAAGCGGGDDNGNKTDAPASATSGPAQTPTPAILDAATILQQNLNTIVKIETTAGQGGFTGSGIVWQDNSHVLTNAHVVIGAGSIKILDPNDATKTFPAKVVALSACDDLALLSVDRAQNLTPAKLGDSEALKAGDHIVALGFPGTISSGPTDTDRHGRQRQPAARHLRFRRTTRPHPAHQPHQSRQLRGAAVRPQGRGHRAQRLQRSREAVRELRHLHQRGQARHGRTRKGQESGLPGYEPRTERFGFC